MNRVLYLLIFSVLLSLAHFSLEAADRPYYIEISISQCRLYLFKQSETGQTIIRTYAVSTVKPGLEIYPFGLGYVTKIDFFPAWYPTAYSRWYFREKKGINLPAKVPPGDKLNYMGDFKIHLSHSTRKGEVYRIHGNNNPSLVGKRVTGGCFRMYNDEGLGFARMISVGTPVLIKK